jgi:serine/threonine protein kinase
MMQAGTRLGPYEVLGLAGAGGMGEVYRARDTRLERTVAIKILPADPGFSAERKQRFEREAKAISSLQHPHICVLYDIGCENGIDYLVMEYLEGETLADRLRKGPLPTEQVLQMGIEIAGALEKAHRQNLVHRDLKPGNIMLTKAGAKLLDFGLAKPVTVALAAVGGEGLATLTRAQHPVTAQGAIVGTFQYMAPEQLQGKEADARSDIFALGAVLYEAASGKPAFTGQSQISVMSAILEREPEPITSLNAASPPALDFVLRACLAKDPDQRIQTAHDVGLQLKWIAGSSTTALPGGGVPRPRRKILPLAGWIAAAALVAVLAAVWIMRQPSPMRVERFVIPLPAKHTLPGDIGSVAISSDGSKVAFAASESGNIQLFVQPLDSFDPIPIPNSDGATFPFFSPDGRWVIFYSRAQLWKAASDGSMNPTAIATMPTFYGGSWSQKGSLILGTNPPLVTLSPDGGTPTPIALKGKLDSGNPIQLPGSDWILVTNDRETGLDILAVRESTGEMRTLLSNAMQPIYVHGQLIYYSSGSLWVAPFDAKSAQLKGTATVLAKDVAGSRWFGHFAASQSGTLIYVVGGGLLAARNLVWVDRKGEPTKIDAPAQDYVDPSIAPDGKHFVVCVRTSSQQSVAVYNLASGGMMRMSNNTFRSAAPIYDSTGKYLFFDAVDGQGKRALFRMPSDGSAAPERVREIPSFAHITSIAGGRASVTLNDPSTKADLWMMSLDGKEFTPFRKTPAAERQGSFSPDGKYLAYVSDESGRSEVYVELASGSGARWQVSNEGGEQPRWSHKGNEIFYRSGTKMMSVAVQENPFTAMKPVQLFDAYYDQGGAVAGYDVSADGQRFLMGMSEDASPTQIRVIVGWPQEITNKRAKPASQ